MVKILGVPKEKISDETPLELAVEAKAQWILLRKEISSSSDLIPPLPADNVLLSDVFMDKLNRSAQYDETEEGKTDKWLSQVEIITHAGPHRRLWMGPQFTFRVRNFISFSSSSNKAYANNINILKYISKLISMSNSIQDRRHKNNPTIIHQKFYQKKL